MNNQDAILQQLAAIPYGQTTSYGALAKAAGLPGYARYVGQILKKLPKDTKLPWHRVINGQNKISFPEASSAFDEQKKRLESEGLKVNKSKVTQSKANVS